MKRHWYQFGLPTLLIGVLCWLVLDHVRLIHERDQAILKELSTRQLELNERDELLLLRMQVQMLKEAQQKAKQKPISQP
jgi:hypothetical protein